MQKALTDLGASFTCWVKSTINKCAPTKVKTITTGERTVHAGANQLQLQHLGG